MVLWGERERRAWPPLKFAKGNGRLPDIRVPILDYEYYGRERFGSVSFQPSLDTYLRTAKALIHTWFFLQGRKPARSSAEPLLPQVGWLRKPQIETPQEAELAYLRDHSNPPSLPDR